MTEGCVSMFRVVLVALLAVGLAGCNFFDDEEYVPPQGEGPWVLVDRYHSRMQNHVDYQLDKDTYGYQGVFGYHRAMQHLTEHGFKTSELSTMPLSEERLEGFDILFINLVDQSRPDFTEEEHELIEEWVAEGGSLFVIADHTNVYRHAERLNPFLEPMGVEIGFHTLVEPKSGHSVAGDAWPLVFDFEPHYITEGVDMVSMQTGAPLLSDHGVAFASEESFADYWDEEDEGGFYGNWSHDGDEELEPLGPLAMVVAREYGDGRLAVTGDQNMFGDAWLHYGNNFELFMNIFQWLARQEDQPPVRAAPTAGVDIGVELVHNEFQVRKGRDGYYIFFVHMNRDEEVTTSGRIGVDVDDDVLVLLEPTVEFDRFGVERIERFFDQGKTVVLSFEADDIPAATLDLLEEIAPDFSLTADGQTHRLSDGDREQLEELDVDAVEGPLELESGEVDVDDLELSSFDRRGSGLSRYLLEITSEWGDPFITAESGEQHIDLARRKSIAHGELIVFVQDGFWRNRTMGNKETDEPNEENIDAVRLQYRLLDYLKETAR